MKICNQMGCATKAAYLFTWPGKDEDGICEEHAPQLRAVAQAAGMRLQLKPVEPVENENEERSSPA